jgi:hypothetical protein
VIFTEPLQPLPITNPPGFPSTLHPFDIDGDGTADFSFGAAVGGLSFNAEPGNFFAYSPDPPPNIGGDVGPLPEGSIIGEALTLIDPSLIWNDRGATMVVCVDIGCGGLFHNRDAYIGLQFERPDGTHYGYIHFVPDDDSPTGFVHDWAWESRSDTPIVAGAIPEPSTASVIAVAVGFLCLRRPNDRPGRIG